jgi:hypothetical protein
MEGKPPATNRPTHRTDLEQDTKDFVMIDVLICVLFYYCNSTYGQMYLLLIDDETIVQMAEVRW